jgi:30S ribosomal protein 3
VRRSGAKAFTTALPRPAAHVQQQLLSFKCRTAAEEEVIDLEQVSVQGLVDAPVAGSEDQEFTLEELTEAAASTHYNSLAVADIEAAFLEGTADLDTASYLASLVSEAEDLQLSGKGRAAEAATAQLAAVAAELAETGDLPEGEMKEDLGVLPMDAVEHDVLESLSNDEAIQARQVVAALKLSKQELQEHLLPEDWDQTTVDWFTNQKEQDLPLPEYKLVFLWMDSNIAVAVDQVYARGNSSPLTEYFVWPRKDAWEELKLALEARPWISDKDKILLLNRLTDIINFWMGASAEPVPDGTPAARPTIEDARANFPDCTFAGGL